MPRPRIVLASRELHPFMGGGIAPIMSALAIELSRAADVTLVTTASHREEHDRLSAAGPLFGERVEVLFAEEPEPIGYGGYTSYMHAWSARLFERIAEHFGDRGPDLIEFPDYLGEGFVTVQARRMGEPVLRDTQVIVRTHTSAEMTSVLNASLVDDFGTRAVFEIERYCLREADALAYPGGDVLATYERFYGREALAPAVRLHEAFRVDFEPVAEEPPGPGPLRMLFLGRLERRKGVQDLVRALERSAQHDWELTFLGGDTETAPLGTSMRAQLEMAAAGDPRITFAEPVPRSGVGHVISAHDVVVVPSKWECWPNVVREAYLHNRPVIGTPVGGLTEMVEHGVSGWLAREATPAALLDVLEGLIEDPAPVRAAIDAGAPRAAFDRLVDGDRTREDYLGVIGRPARGDRAARPGRGRSDVSVVVPYFRMHEHVAETVDSILAQTVAPAEVILVVDGSFSHDDEIVERLAERHALRVVAQPNTGLSAARNLGVSVARSRHVLPLDPDNCLEPEFAERCLHMLDRDESLAYVTTWSRYIDEQSRPVPGETLGFQPLGSWSRLVDENNVAGDGTAVLRRRVFDLGYRYHVDLTSYEDWFLYRQLHHAGYTGDVIPRRLFRYRIRTESMLRSTGLAHIGRLFAEMNALLIESEVPWQRQSA